MEVILEGALSMREDELVDIGAIIAQRFPDWPRTESGPCELPIKKTSSNGCEVALGSVSVSGPFERKAGKVIKQDLCKIVKTANDQMGLAKSKGAKETILLLDCDPLFERPEDLRNRLATLDKGTLTNNIDYIYLVSKLPSKDSYQALFEGTIEEKIKVTELHSKNRRGHEICYKGNRRER